MPQAGDICWPCKVRCTCRLTIAQPQASPIRTTKIRRKKNKAPGNDLVCLVLQSAGELWRFLLYSLFIVAIATRVLVGIWAAFQIGSGCCCGRTACGFGYLGVKLWPRCRSMFEKTTRALTLPICGSRPAIFPAGLMEGCLMHNCWRFTTRLLPLEDSNAWDCILYKQLRWDKNKRCWTFAICIPSFTARLSKNQTVAFPNFPAMGNLEKNNSTFLLTSWTPGGWG